MLYFQKAFYSQDSVSRMHDIYATHLIYILKFLIM
jgi:hypothetical protein